MSLSVLQETQAYVRLSLAFVAFSLLACSSNPYTDRSQLLLMSPSQEAQLGAQAYAQILHDPKVRFSQDSREVEPVRQVAKRIIEVAKASKYAEVAQQFKWEVSVIKDDKTLNAFALPGGKIAVYTGIFPIAKNEAGLAAILGHEVVHALARHGGERVSQGLLSQLGLEAANIALTVAGSNPIVGQSAMAALGVGANVGILLPFSRAYESEADYIGLLFAAQAGYDPREAVRVWERMEQASKGQPAEFLSTHPSHGTRIKQLEEWMNEALSYYQPQPGIQAADLPFVSVR
ncbi:MAG: M48 family metallopeptidase [Candidatus Methylomirabilis sp.]